MQNKTMKNVYLIARIFLVIITFIIFNVMFMNEDVSWKFLPAIFALIVFGISYPSSIISKKLINIGNRLKNKNIKFLYYAIVLPIISFLLLSSIILVMYFIYENFPIQNEFSLVLGQGLMFLFLIILITICIVVPYIQTLIVLIIKHFIKD